MTYVADKKRTSSACKLYECYEASLLLHNIRESRCVSVATLRRKTRNEMKVYFTAVKHFTVNNRIVEIL